MAVRFHRSVKIAKGVRLNISKKGLGVSLGPPGAKVSIGPSGVYTSVGVPGTGLYVRDKISGSTSKKTSHNQKNRHTNLVEKHFDVEVSIDDETGVETVKMFDRGHEVTDPSLLRKLRGDPIFKERLAALRARTQLEIEEKTNILLNIHKYSPPLPDWDTVREELTTHTAKLYERQKFLVEKPTPELVYNNIENEARMTVKSIFGRKRKRKEYIEQRLDRRIIDELLTWQAEKNLFEAQEDELEAEKNNQYLTEFNTWKSNVQNTLQASVEFITQRLDEQLSEIQLPVEFSVSFGVLDNGKKIYLDIDLPEIEDFPQKKSRILSTGKLSVKNKTSKELKWEYLRSVTGMSIYFATIGFSITPIVEEVVISGYTQRINRATGNVEDQYVYSVKYDHQRFRTLDIDAIEPELTLRFFEHRIDIGSQYDLRPIKPFETNASNA